MSEKGIDYLRQKLIKKQNRVSKRYKFYEMKNIIKDFGISTPPKLNHWQSCLGWCAKSVDALADRLSFREFGDDNFEIDEIFRMNNADILIDSAILEAMIGSCSFIYISQNEDGYPRMQVITAEDATGFIDPITGMLKEGYAVLDRDEYGIPVLEAHLLPGRTDIYRKGEEKPESYYYQVQYPLLVPVIYRPDSKRPFGHSRISRACMNLVESACRTIKRSEISAEFYSFPQKWITGLSEDVEMMDKWGASMSYMMQIFKDEDGDSPKVGQFTQQSMEPHISQFKMFAAAFAGETGLTLDDLGFSTGNPASADAIKASHDTLRLTARKAQKTFGTGLLNAGYLAACVRDEFAYQRKQFYLTKPIWEPIFEPDAAMLAGIGDGAVKINQAVPGYFASDNLSVLTGIPKSREPITVQESGINNGI